MVNTAKLSKVLALGELRGMDLDDMSSAIKQAIDHPDCGPNLVLLDVKEVWNVADLGGSHVLTLLHQRINPGWGNR